MRERHSQRSLICFLSLSALLTWGPSALADGAKGDDAAADIQAENTGRTERIDRTPTRETVDRADDPFDVRADIEAKQNRYVPAVFPFAGGNSDVGVQLGVAGNVTRFQGQSRPYAWALNGVLTTSIKPADTGGIVLAQHDYVLRFVAPDMLEHRVKLDLITEFVRTIDAGYWGIGNATSAPFPPGKDAFGRTFQYLRTEARERMILRLTTGTPLDVVVGGILRYETPEVYAGSKLAVDVVGADAHGNSVLGRTPMALAGGALGIMVDTRDTQFVTRRGVFYQVGAGVTTGSAEGVRYGQLSAVLAHYVSLSRTFTFASRFIGSFEFGDVPFYDLQQGGVFEPQYMLGGANGVRGVPQGRYAGRVKVLSNLELRATPLSPFVLFRRPFLVGSTLFVDAGRAFADYRNDPIADGRTLAPKLGAGAGIFAFWGSSALFRVEVAYSPDAVSQNPNLPVGIYVADGLMF